MARVKSNKLASGTAPDAKGAAEGSEKPQDVQNSNAEDDEPEEEEGASEPETDADDGDDAELEEDDASEGENEPVSGVTAEDLAAGQQKGRPKRAPTKVPEIPDGHEPVLSSPRPFGIWIEGKLHRFAKGRTPLTQEQHDACHLDTYVRDNGASISYRPAKKYKSQ